jgi:SAM-dependent methyltransferase
MNQRKVDYNSLAGTYDVRYDTEPLQGIADALVDFIHRRKAAAVLEVGCGTGRWLREVQEHVSLTAGADASIEMLRNRRGSVPVVAARANTLPFRPGTFDLVYCVNAVHHFDDPHRFVSQAAELLKPAGSLAFIGIDPRLIRTRYFYDYFDSTRDTDMRRYPSIGAMVDWMAAAGFNQIEYRVVQTWISRFTGRSVFEDKFLRKESNSTLALLSEEEYQAGIRKMEAAIARAESEGREITFDTVMPFGMLTASQSV